LSALLLLLPPCFMQHLQEENLSTMQTFDMKRSQPLPPLLLPYLRLAYATTHEQLDKVRQVLHCTVVFHGFKWHIACMHMYSS
jgi:hypothetical protein